MRICELREKEVINVCDGERLGFVEDMIFDLCKGCISHIVVPKNCKFMGIFGKEEEYIIDLRCICQVGNDIILVEMPPEKKNKIFVKNNFTTRRFSIMIKEEIIEKRLLG